MSMLHDSTRTIRTIEARVRRCGHVYVAEERVGRKMPERDPPGRKERSERRHGCSEERKYESDKRLMDALKENTRAIGVMQDTKDRVRCRFYISTTNT